MDAFAKLNAESDMDKIMKLLPLVVDKSKHKHLQTILSKTRTRSSTFSCKHCPLVTQLATTDQSSCLICAKCGYIERIINNHRATDQPELRYLTLTHFNKHLNALLGIRKTKVPKEIIDKMQQLKDIKQANSVDLPANQANLTNENIRKVLKRKKWTKLYNAIPYLISTTGQELPQLTSIEQESLKNSFIAIDGAFVDLIQQKKVVRTNMNYYLYLIYKLLELQVPAKMPEFKPLIHLQKTPTLIENDRIWKLICEVLAWKFIKTGA
jgi:hypothetical protein